MQNFTILVVDDIEENIYSLKLLIEDSFPEVTVLSASNAKDAILLLMKNSIDLILSDIQMPEISGFELIEYLQGIEQTKDIPVILITGIHDSDDYRKKGFSSGAIDYITKPIDDILLCSKLKVFIDIYDNRRKDKAQIALKDKALATKVKVNAMMKNLDTLPTKAKEQMNLEAYAGILGGSDSLDLSNVIDLDEE